jgi:nicotinamide-nucleotide amidase
MYGAVSQPVVEEMARGVLRSLKTDWAIAVSGIAGPEGGTEEKPVGTVWIAIACGEKNISRVYHFGNQRESTIIRSANTALLMLLEEIE